MPGDPHIDAQLVHRLKEKGASAYTLERFARHLRSLPLEAALPCPFCFGLGQESELVEQTRIRDIHTVRCPTCGDQITLRERQAQ